MSAPIRVLIVNDHPVVRNGLSGMFAGEPAFEVVGEAADGSEALRRARALSPDVILMDLRMPNMDGVSAIAALAGAGVPARVHVLTTYDTDSDVLPAIEAGATGYLLKDAPPTELFRAVRAAANGEAVLSPAVATRLMGQMRTRTEEPISQRELEVLELIAEGHSNRDTAARLFISEATVKTHLTHIYAKLAVNDRAAAVAEAFNRGLLIPRAAIAVDKTHPCERSAGTCNVDTDDCLLHRSVRRSNRVHPRRHQLIAPASGSGAWAYCRRPHSQPGALLGRRKRNRRFLDSSARRRCYRREAAA